jgi:hypothetical protein
VKQGRQEEGIRWYKQAADLGCPAGQCNLGLAYMLGIIPSQHIFLSYCSLVLPVLSSGQSDVCMAVNYKLAALEDTVFDYYVPFILCGPSSPTNTSTSFTGGFQILQMPPMVIT